MKLLNVFLILVTAVTLMGQEQWTHEELEIQAHAKKDGWIFKKNHVYKRLKQHGINKTTGYIPHASELPFMDIKEELDLPATFSLRHGTGLPAVKDQGAAGTCWAFSTTGVMEILNFLRTGIELNFSEQEIVSCSGKGSTNGGWNAASYQVSHGQGLEKDFPYVAKDVRCKEIPPADRLISASAMANPTREKIKTLLLKGVPVSVTVAANSAFMGYSGGNFGGRACSRGQVNHMVILTGWDEKGWEMRNSWGENWGENGYMRINYGCAKIGSNPEFVEYK